MSGYIAFVDAAQKYRKIRLLNRNIDLVNEVTENIAVIEINKIK